MKKDAGKNAGSMGLDECFKVLETNLTLAIDTMDDVKGLKAARKELKRYRLAISALARQVKLHEKENRS